MQLISDKPETEAVVKEKLTGLHKMWEVLESTTQTKAQRLFDANKAELFTQSCADLDKWLHGLALFFVPHLSACTGGEKSPAAKEISLKRTGAV